MRITMNQICMISNMGLMLGHLFWQGRWWPRAPCHCVLLPAASLGWMKRRILCCGGSRVTIGHLTLSHERARMITFKVYRKLDSCPFTPIGDILRHCNTLGLRKRFFLLQCISLVPQVFSSHSYWTQTSDFLHEHRFFSLWLVQQAEQGHIPF